MPCTSIVSGASSSPLSSNQRLPGSDLTSHASVAVDMTAARTGVNNKTSSVILSARITGLAPA